MVLIELPRRLRLTVNTWRDVDDDIKRDVTGHQTYVRRRFALTASRLSKTVPSKSWLR